MSRDASRYLDENVFGTEGLSLSLKLDFLAAKLSKLHEPIGLRVIRGLIPAVVQRKPTYP